MTPISPTQLVVIAIIIVMIAVMLASTRRRLRDRGPSPSEYAREQIVRLKEHRDLKGDMDHLLAELDDASRRLNAQVETKAAKLEALIRDADERLARLQACAAGPDGSSPVNGRGQAQPNRQGPVIDGSPLPGKDPSPRPDRASDPVRRRILALAEQGKTPVEIAQDTGVRPGEVELILALGSAG